jgi:hypothetical protein
MSFDTKLNGSKGFQQKIGRKGVFVDKFPTYPQPEPRYLHPDSTKIPPHPTAIQPTECNKLVLL